MAQSAAISGKKPIAWDGIHNKEIQINQSFRRILLVDGYSVASRWELSVDSTGCATITIIASTTKDGATSGWWYSGDKYKILFTRRYIEEVSVASMAPDGVFKIVHPLPEWGETEITPYKNLYIKVI